MMRMGLVGYSTAIALAAETIMDAASHCRQLRHPNAIDDMVFLLLLRGIAAARQDVAPPARRERHDEAYRL